MRRFILIFAVCSLSLFSKGQEILGNKNPCPGPSEYTLNYSSVDNYYFWTIKNVQSGQFIEGFDKKTVKINWAKWSSNDYVDLECSYKDSTKTVKSVTLRIKVQRISPISGITGKMEVEYGFRGDLSYSANLLDPGAKPQTYQWSTTTGWAGSSTSQQLNLNVNNDGDGAITVKGINTTCGASSDAFTLFVKRVLPKYQIIGQSDLVCNIQRYSLIGNLPANTTVNWSIDFPNVASIQFNTRDIDVSRIDDGYITITASFIAWGNQVTLTKNLYVGAPTMPWLSFIHGDGQFGWNSGVSDNRFIVDPNGPQADKYEVEILQYPNLNRVYSSTNVNSDTPLGGFSPGYYVFRIRGINGCGTGQWFEYDIESESPTAGGGSTR